MPDGRKSFKDGAKRSYFRLCVRGDTYDRLHFLKYHWGLSMVKTVERCAEEAETRAKSVQGGPK